MSQDLLKELILKLKEGEADKLIGLFGAKPTYTGESLKEIEDKINIKYPVGHMPLITTLIPFGFYFGETIIRNFKGANWVTEGVSDF